MYKTILFLGLATAAVAGCRMGIHGAVGAELADWQVTPYVVQPPQVYVQPRYDHDEWRRHEQYRHERRHEDRWYGDHGYYNHR